MSSSFTRFLSDGGGPVSASDSWPGWEDFSIRRLPTAGNYGRSLDHALPDAPFNPKAKNTGWEPVPVPRSLPEMPHVGLPPSSYIRLLQQAENAHDPYLYAAAKVGQYITLAIDPHLSWGEKLKHFQHALTRYCTPPPFPDDQTWIFYQNLGELVRQHCSAEALRLASAEDDLFASRLNMGQTREKIEEDAEKFFLDLMGRGNQRPDWFSESDWSQLKVLRDQWI